MISKALRKSNNMKMPRLGCVDTYWPSHVYRYDFHVGSKSTALSIIVGHVHTFYCSTYIVFLSFFFLAEITIYGKLKTVYYDSESL